MDRCDVAVSVIVPVFNSEKYLRECMDSIVTQGFSSFEVICIDDCSTDNSRDILYDYEKSYACVHVFLNETNRGIAYTRNRGLDLAKGEYIQFVDSDDMLKPSAIEQLYQTADSCNAQILIYNFETRDELFDSPTTEGIDTSFMEVGKAYTGNELFCLMKQKGINIGAVWLALWEKKIIEERHHRFSEKLVVAEDILFVFQVLMESNRVFIINNTFYVHRRRGGSLTTNPMTTAPYSFICCIIELWRYWREHSSEHAYNMAMRKYLLDLYSGFYDYIERNIGFIEKCSLDNPADVFMFHLLREHHFEHCVKINETKINEIQRAKRVFVFGAGVYGREAIYALQRENVIPNAIIVSKKSRNPDFVYGVRVLAIDEIKFKDSDIVIVAVKLAYADEIVEALISSGCKQYLFPYEQK